MKLPLIAANWKMHKNRREAREFCQALVEHLPSRHLQHVLLAPPFTGLETVVEAVAATPILVAAQNCHGETHGAYTGEVSAPMLADLRVEWVLLGHSERRHVFGETDALIARRLEGALNQGLKAVLCVGETLAEREEGRTEAVVARQMQPLEKISDLWQNIVLAYEPVWAIGTGRTATPQQAQDAHAFIRRKLAELWDSVTADKVRIQYGGSVKPANTAELMSQPDIDGALVGGASLDPRGFAEIVLATVKLAR
jgi:triosephosphate isomerase